MAGDNFIGILIEESFEKTDVLKKVTILETKIEKVISKHKTPWLTQWTLHTVEVSEANAEKIAEEISTSLDSKHAGSWYADFKNRRWHYLIFCEKVFRVDRTKKEEYDAAAAYGQSIGIPQHQLTFSSEIEV